MLKIDFDFKGYKGLEKEKIKKALSVASQELGLKKGNLSVAFISCQESQKINYSYRRKNYFTDVLSFLYSQEPWEGEILICPFQARKQARQYKHSYGEEILALLAHGLAHLAGYDHQTEQQRKVMQKKEAEIWQKIKKYVF